MSKRIAVDYLPSWDLTLVLQVPDELDASSPEARAYALSQLEQLTPEQLHEAFERALEGGLDIIKIEEL